LLALPSSRQDASPATYKSLPGDNAGPVGQQLSRSDLVPWHKREVLMRAYNVGSLWQKQTSCKAHCYMATQTSGRGSASPPFSFFHATAMAALAAKGMAAASSNRAT
jgi:hypothetical protein